MLPDRQFSEQPCIYKMITLESFSMKKTMSVFNIAFTMLLSCFLLVQVLAVVTDVHINKSEEIASVHHIDSHGLLSNHDHTEHDGETYSEGHCCHAYTSTSITSIASLSITIMGSTSSNFRLPADHYSNPPLDRLQRPPKT